MSDEIQVPRHDASGVSLYGVLVNDDEDSADHGEFVLPATGASEAMVVAHWGDYDIPLTEAPASSYRYVGDAPAGLPMGPYVLEIFEQGGGAPAIGDVMVAAAPVWFDGSVFRRSNKTQEQHLAIAGGKQTHVAATGVTQNYHRDGATVAVTQTLTGGGNRDAPTLP